MKPLFRFLITVVMLCITVASAQGQCGNNSKNGSTNYSTDTCPKSGDPFDPYTGNEYRVIRDLEVWGSVGEIPLVWKRYAYSRYGSFLYNFGFAHNWNNSFNYNMADAGVNDQGQPQLYLHYAEGGSNYFTRDAHDPSLWLPIHAVDKRLFQEGNNFYLQMNNGHRYRFEKLTDNAGAAYYQLQDIRDSKQNLYTLTYNNRRLTRITEPAGRYLNIDYSIITMGVAYPVTVINRVSTSDGRRVRYHYSIIRDALTNYAWVSLDTVYYGDGTAAVYTYSQSEPGLELNLEHAIDPRYEGTDADMRFTYDNSNTWGFIKEEKNGVTGEVMATLNATAGKRTVCYANGRVQVFDMPGELMGRTKAYSDGLGRKTLRTYEGGLGYLETETDALGRVTTYNSRTVYGNPLEVTYPDGSQQQWTRDDLDLIVTQTDELGRITTYTRNNRHLIRRIDYPDGTHENFTYNNFAQVLTHTHRNGGLLTNIYDSRGLKTGVIDAEGNVTQYTYDNASRVAAVKDARGNIARIEYNERGLITRYINADGSFQAFTYDGFGNPAGSTNEIGNTWKTGYDEFKRPERLIDPLGRLTLYHYDLPGGVCGCSHDNATPTSITLPSGKVTKMDYDVEWQMTGKTIGAGSADAALTAYEYDATGNLVTLTDPRGKDWNYTYDQRNRKKSATDPLGNKTGWTYDGAGNVLTIRRPDNHVTYNNYDNMNRLVQSTDPIGQVTGIGYDAEGNLIRLTDANGQRYGFEYDLLNRRTRMIYPDNSTERRAYDETGNLMRYRNRKGDVCSFVYDNRDREILADWNDETPDVFSSYDEASRLNTISSSVSTVTFTYNEADEQKTETQHIAGVQVPGVFRYTYTPDGLRETLTYPGNTVLKYDYTGRNQFAAITQNNLPPLVRYTYDLSGNRTAKALRNGTGAAYTYDDANKTLSVDNQKAAVSFARFDYGYDQVDRRTFVKRNQGRGDVYQYDPVDQLTRVQYEATNPEGMPGNAVRTIRYQYDATGNRTQVTDNGASTSYDANALNQYTDVGGNALTYNANGNLKTFSGWAFTFDAQNRLIKAVKGSVRADFAYDPLNRCVQRTIQGTISFFYYDIWNLVQERNAGGAVMAQYTFGPQIDEILTKTSPANIVYYHHDALLNTVRLTNAGGNVVEQYAYDVFGIPAIKDAGGNAITTSAFGNRFLFTSREYLEELRLYDYRNRMYSADLGRFLQPDPLKFDAKDVNLYRYVWNNAVNWVDPLGLIDTDPNGINCIGYATGAGQAIAPDVKKGESLKDLTESQGFKCTGPTAKACECKCEEERIVVYIYKYLDNPKGADPFKDPWIRSKGKNDYHAIKSNTGCNGPWTYVPHYFPDKTDPKAKPQTTPNPNDPDSYWGGNVPKERYCCCKPKK